MLKLEIYILTTILLANLIEAQMTKRFQRFVNYEIISPWNSTCKGEEECVQSCITNGECTAISMNSAEQGRCKSGRISKYGRAFLKPKAGWTTWIRGRSFNQIVFIFL